MHPNISLAADMVLVITGFREGLTKYFYNKTLDCSNKCIFSVTSLPKSNLLGIRKKN